MTATSDKFAQLKHFLSTFASLPEAEWAFFQSRLSVRTYAPGAFFQRAEDSVLHLGFVLSGLFRVFYCDSQGKEFIRAFSAESKPIGDYASALAGSSAKVAIEAIEASEVALIPFSEFFQLFERHPAWDRLGRKVLEAYYVEREQREAELAMLSARERYENFIKKHRVLAGRAANVHIASYLGMTPETLSRLRRQMKADESP